MEDVALEARMRGIGAVVAAEAPHVVCLQEVTPAIEALFRAAPWWRAYDASPAPGGAPYYTLLLLRRPTAGGGDAKGVPPLRRTPFANSAQGRDLLAGGLPLGGGVRLLAGTSHLESFLRADMNGSEQRKAQIKTALSALDAAHDCGNAVFAGDLNWDDGTDGDVAARLPPGWRDAWTALRPGEPGHTYDAPANAMLMARAPACLPHVAAP